MQTKQHALQIFDQRYNCCQSVVIPFADSFGVTEETANRMAAGFGGGIGHMGETCGVVTGACMVLGLLAGTKHPQNPEMRDLAYELMGEFVAQFRQRVGALTCRELSGLEISDPLELQRGRDENIFKTVCPNYVIASVEILEGMLAKYRDRPGM